jgi:hypothetical protein
MPREDTRDRLILFTIILIILIFLLWAIRCRDPKPVYDLAYILTCSTAPLENNTGLEGLLGNLEGYLEDPDNRVKLLVISGILASLIFILLVPGVLVGLIVLILSVFVALTSLLPRWIDSIRELKNSSTGGLDQGKEVRY